MVPARYGRTASSALLIFALGFVALLGTIVVAATPAAAAGLDVSPPTVAFGNVVIGTNSPARTVSAANSSKGAIQFERTLVSGPFLTMGNTCGGSLGSGQTCQIQVVCDPTVLGSVTGTLTLFLNKDQKATVNLTCTGLSPTQVSVAGTAIQNGMKGATISAVLVNPDGSDGSILTVTTADSGGQFSMIVSELSGPVRFRASAGSYVSEQNGATISTPSSLSVLLPSLQNSLTGLSVNPLTTFVDSLAQGNISRGQNLLTALSNSTALIEQDYGISTDPSTLIPLYTSAAVGTDAGRLGLILGALVNEDQLACASAPGGLVNALSSDISDGVFDGTKSGAAVSFCGANLATIAGTAQFSDALSGLQELTLATSGFTFGGTNNALSLNGVIAADLAADAATIEDALVAAVPPSVNTFAAAGPAMNNLRESATATLLPTGKVLIAGGRGANGNLSSTELYDPVTDTFAAITPVMNASREFATATLLPTGKVLIAGGQGTIGCCSFPILSSTELYDPASNTFAASTPSMNAARLRATATLLPSGKVLIAGGENVDLVSHTITYYTSTELYDPVSNTFAATPPVMNTGRTRATATLLSNGKVLIAGGFGNAGYLNSTELYDPVSDTFAASTPSMNTARYDATATLLPNGKVLIAGGDFDNTLSSTELYDPVTNTFAAATPAMNGVREAATSTLLPSGKVLIAGGDDNSGLGHPLGSTELYDPATNTFAASTPSMNNSRLLATATLLPNGKVLIAGGEGVFGIISGGNRELYTP